MRCKIQDYFVLTMLAFLLIECSPEDPRQPKVQAYHQLDSLNALLMRELTTHRVVMFGDFHPGYAQCVSAFLHEWLRCVEHEPLATKVPRNLVLALGIGGQAEVAMNDFLRTGDRYALVKNLLDEQQKFGFDMYFTKQLTVDYLQFCEELHEVKCTIDSLNHQRPADSISFDIIGAEPEPPYKYLDFRTLPRQRFFAMKSHWDVSTRGLEAATRLADYLSQHPAQKVIFFANANHLIRDTKDGYFTAHSLDSLIGRQHVMVFQISKIPRTPLSGPQIEEYKHEGEGPDYLVRKPAIPPSPFPFFVVKSQNTLRAMVDLAEKYSLSSDTLELDLSRKLLGNTLELLRRSHLALVSAGNQEIASKQALVAAASRRAFYALNTYSDIRRLISRFDAVRDIIEFDSVMTTFAPSQDFFNDLVTIMDNLSSRSHSLSDTVIVRLAQHPSVDSIKANWARTWKASKSERRTYMLLQLLSLGTPKEVEGAMGQLALETGYHFGLPAQWRDWWLSKR